MPAPGTLGTGAKPRGLRSSFPIRRKHVDRNQAARWRSCWRSSQGEGRKPSNGREWLSVADPQDVPEIPCEAEANSLDPPLRSEEHTSELQSLMRISYAVFFLKKKQYDYNTISNTTSENTQSYLSH